MTGITESRLAELEALANAATAGPWDFLPVPELDSDAFVDVVAVKNGKQIACDCDIEDAAFIAASRQAIPDLIAALRDAWAERDALVDRVRALADEWEAKTEYAERQTSVYVPPEEARDYDLYAYIVTKRIGELRAALEADA